METISESIRADVPAGFADRMWSEFVFRSQSAGRPRSLSDTRWWVDESPVEKGTVKFARSGDRSQSGSPLRFSTTAIFASMGPQSPWNALE